VLREGGAETGEVDGGGGRDTRQLHCQARRGILEVAAQECRAAPVRQELPAAVDQLPPGGREEGEHLQGGRGRHHQAPRHPWQQVVPDRGGYSSRARVQSDLSQKGFRRARTFR